MFDWENVHPQSVAQEVSSTKLPCELFLDPQGPAGAGEFEPLFVPGVFLGPPNGLPRI